ncbi:MAG: DUF3574 domain-containing protein [Solobacterium sp.]|nr:DUF3574 domain-containing protein [Solobacterium sp.]
MKQTTIYIGLNDQDTKKQEHETSKYLSVLKRVCVSYKVPFSVQLIQGGYIHENGEYTEENTLVLSLIGVERELIEEIAKDLCVFFHQESVLITSDEVETYSIRNDLTKEDKKL